MAITDKIKKHAKSIYIDKLCEKETLILVSPPRSGSTWIQNLITSMGVCRIMFEPFHPNQVPCFAHWTDTKYIGRYESDEENLALVRSVVSGSVRNTWIDQDNRPFLFLPRNRFIKTIRANLFIAWLKEHFPRVKVILLTRHPFSTAKSQLQCGWPMEPRSLLEQSNLAANHFTTDDKAFLEGLSTPFGKQVGIWTIQNLVSLRELNKDDALAISYEDVYAAPEQQLDRIKKFIGSAQSEAATAEVLKASRTKEFSRKKSIKISSEAIDEAARTLNRFGMSRIYPSAEPVPPGLQNYDLFSLFDMPS